MTSALLLAMPSAALAVADPASLTTVSGATTSTLTGPGQLLTQQTTDRAIIQGANVDVLAGESWRIQQPGSSSALLVRVTGGQPTQILGNLSANGQLMLVNGAGVFFGAGSQVNVAGMIASTADISNDNFNAGH
ncbi:MAG: filamentous hemagglutinin N-terminal domain-containing protein, partial [Proteobacteria bacterium]|nr:filamentous hemagglutinin N-terminal domain-containing protein [Pseudomonadota bacterium]